MSKSPSDYRNRVHNEGVHRSIVDAGFSNVAQFWDGLHGDRTDEVRFWAKLASRYGKRVLAPLAATGELAVSLARQGFEVLALDCCQDMVSVAKSKAQAVEGFACMQGTVAELDWHGPPFDFIFFAGGDYHHYYDEVGQLTVLESVHRLLRQGGGLGLEMVPFSPDRPSYETSALTAASSTSEATLRVRSESTYEASSRMLQVDETMLIDRNGNVEEHRFHIPLRMFTRVELMASLAQVGFRHVAEFGSLLFEPLTRQSKRWVVLAEHCHGC